METAGILIDIATFNPLIIVASFLVSLGFSGICIKVISRLVTSNATLKEQSREIKITTLKQKLEEVEKRLDFLANKIHDHELKVQRDIFEAIKNFDK